MERWICASIIWAPRAAVAAIILGLTVLAGYAVGYEPLWRPMTGGPATHPLTAVTVILIGLSAHFARPSSPSNVSAALALIAGIIAFTRLVAIGTGRGDLFQAWSPFGDTLATAASHGQPIAMGLRATVMLALLAIALVLIRLRRPFASQIAALLAAYPPIYTFIAYAHGVTDMHGILSASTLAGGILCIAAVLGRTTHRAQLRSLMADCRCAQMFRLRIMVLVGLSVALGLIATRPGFGMEAKTLAAGVSIICLAIVMVLANTAYHAHQTARLRHPVGHPVKKPRLLLELEGAANRGEFFLLYQPQIDLQEGGLVGAEALMRWKQPNGGLVPPADFIPLAESSGLINRLGLWVLEEACGEAARWQGSVIGRATIAVNVSPIQLNQPGFADAVRRIAQAAGLELSRLILEITEGAMVPANSEGLRVLAQLRASGVRIAIDDFGTGYSSLSYLRDLPSDVLKIDQSFVRDLPGDPRAEAIARAIVAVGKSLGHRILAEGIETPEQAEFLRSIGCDKGQGYLFARPMPAAELEAWAEAAAGVAPLDARLAST